MQWIFLCALVLSALYLNLRGKLILRNFLQCFKVLGLGNSRGRLYTRHAGLLRYPADSVDKEWIASHNLVNAVGGKTYIMV